MKYTSEMKRARSIFIENLREFNIRGYDPVRHMSLNYASIALRETSVDKSELTVEVIKVMVKRLDKLMKSARKRVKSLVDGPYPADKQWAATVVISEEVAAMEKWAREREGLIVVELCEYGLYETLTDVALGL